MAYASEHSTAIHIKPDRMELEQILNSYFHYVRAHNFKFIVFFLVMIYIRKMLVHYEYFGDKSMESFETKMNQNQNQKKQDEFYRLLSNVTENFLLVACLFVCITPQALPQSTMEAIIQYSTLQPWKNDQISFKSRRALD